MLVSNSTPLIALARIQKLELLPKAYRRVFVPETVFNELTARPERPGAREIAEARWLRVMAIEDAKAVERLRYWLDPGESEAIILAREQNLPLAIDERRGRNVASSLGLQITGTVGILLAFKELELVKEVAPLLDELLGQGIRLSRRLYDHALSLAEER